ncbi:tetratricopeptide repeat protein [Rhodobacteraceae bacterium 2CG4]|uniref:Tetratricopeptide repeat protein 38 n=1 Tax=Halovulum marinum TaxID=2662447 RepID=A0A6L5YYR2_9RHOB|nr:tetratricopeptide repeat protein [Halovulum marinum]
MPAAAIGPWNDTIRAFLAHGASTPDHLARALAAAPEFAQGHAVKGLFCLLLGRREMFDTARQCRTTARQAAAGAPPTAREASYLAALDAWLGGQPSQAAATLETVLATEPRDALAMKLIQAIRFVLGQPEAMRRSIEGVLSAWDDHPALGYLKGCYAFALEETGEYAAGETAGREGLLLAPDDAWGLHAVAHVYDMTARAGDGLFWLSGQTHAWAHCNNFRYHVWWHIALMHLDQGQYDAALDLYDTEIRADRTDDYRDIANATSLLSRLEIEGIDVGPRWDELAELAARRTGDGSLVFADLHYMLALIGGRRADAATELLRRMSRDAARRDTEVARLMARPGLSAATGLEAFGEGQYAEAFLNLNAARRDMQSVGGSHAQRDVFERLTIEAALRGGFLNAAERMLADRTQRRGGAVDGYTSRRMDLIAAARQDPLQRNVTGARA